MIDHVSVAVRDLEASARFYAAVLGAIGYALLETRPGTVAFGKKYAEFWINRRSDMAPIVHDSGAMWRCGQHTRRRLMRFMPRRWPRVAAATARLGHGRSTARAIIRRSYAIRTATASRR
jgi:catechol 2,3-dioxygenase-like lactoylglutathione lyase family enzyme